MELCKTCGKEPVYKMGRCHDCFVRFLNWYYKVLGTEVYKNA